VLIGIANHQAKAFEEMLDPVDLALRLGLRSGAQQKQRGGGDRPATAGYTR
jgi:hypothetical protein